ncbi:MAG: glycosyltransferase [Clostridium sp.]|nr:glycosyltransferase [Clostridium sp.]
MECAPILIVTLNRYDHLRRCIESLKQNSLAKDTDLYIGLDYPSDERYQKGYEQVKKYLEGDIDGFRNVIVVRHTVNQGVLENIRILREIVYEKHGRFIFSEDDNEFSPNYLEYMNRCLERYENDESVLAIAGYNYPIDTDGFQGNVFRYSIYFPAWGYGIWREKELQMRKQIHMSFFEQCYRDGSYMRMLSKASRNQYANMVKGMLEYTHDLIKDGQIMEVDLAYGLYMASAGKQMIFPVKSKVRNCGYDGTGVNCGELAYKSWKKADHRNFQYETQKIDEQETFSNQIEECDISQRQLNDRMNAFFSVPKKEYVRVRIAYMASRLLGIKTVRRLIYKLR